ncbi:DUF192 domain-containing protein [Granulosicoccus antarcticus]|uniref:DUF192 domain-containing protein n=1 Tax=Granulosicoccus antarcticus IMCC3135 TaxID=1192854 RepID=A0A2Z2NTK7_9GAMM|nr:DUF192 domain-containing protein [Granulosicoccus antarcticus]ASJ74649.1 hypothetical protein IMCC3135_22895 [Granulosicoccus antarcticus IMCC3135]
MMIGRYLTKWENQFLENKVILRRLSAPLLYAYDANTFVRRLRGLHGVPPLGPTDALIIRPCKAIHTFGLNKPIDVIFMDSSGIILKLATVSPRSGLSCLKGVVAVEMAAGTAVRIGLEVGQKFVPSKGLWV